VLRTVTVKSHSPWAVHAGEPAGSANGTGLVQLDWLVPVTSLSTTSALGDQVGRGQFLGPLANDKVVGSQTHYYLLVDLDDVYRLVGGPR
jgi:hypothetical protein